MVHDTLRAAVGPDLPVTAVTRHEMLRVSLNGDGATLERRDLPG
jgi:hypothetical protein